MNSWEVKDLMPILTAYSEGKQIEKLDHKGKWVFDEFPSFTLPADRYRIRKRNFEFEAVIEVQSEKVATLTVEAETLEQATQIIRDTDNDDLMDFRTSDFKPVDKFSISNCVKVFVRNEFNKRSIIKIT